ncbi:MAG: ABC transporter permease [Thermoanaerobaculia bacterium]|nr:ABC transporter permease [Thermoanaerobaculia bacterium]
MWRYHFQTALKSLRRNPWLTSIVIATIGLGIGVCMTTLTVYYLSSRDPIPAKSDRIVAVRLHNWPVGESPTGGDDPPFELTYRDAQGLVEQGFAKHQAAGYNTDLVIHPEDEKQRPYLTEGRLTTPEFFPMFDVDFAYGAPWTKEQERDRRMVAVLSSEANDKIFGGENSVGRQVRADDSSFTVVGVLKPWKPLPRFYDVNAGAWEETEEVFIPLSLSPVLEARKGDGNTSCFAEADGDTWQAFLDSECVWVQFWAELTSPADLDQYQSMVEGYVASQRDLGRFPRTENVVLVQDVMTYLRDFGVVDDDARVLLGLAFLFLAVCLVNVVGLLLDKFLLNPGELAVRRALGARRKTLLAQRLVEVAILGLGGAALGLAFALAGLQLLRTMNVEEEVSHLDPKLMLVAVGLSVGSALLAGLYPAWRGSRIPPARYLRT